MGASFTNLHARAAATDTIAEALRRAEALPSYLTDPAGGWVSAYPQATENQELAALERIAQAVSVEAATVVYASLVHDSDVWNFAVFDRGGLLDRYCSHPGYFTGRRRKPTGGRIEALLPLCRPGTTAAQLEALFRRHETTEEATPEESQARFAAELERQKQQMAGSYGEIRARFEALGAPMPSLKAMLRKVDRMGQKTITGGGRTDMAEDLTRAFARMLGIPAGHAELGYTYISRGETPEGLARLIPA